MSDKGQYFEPWIEMLLREARERGEFENLPGHGKPLASLNEPDDDLWWVKGLIRRENLSYTPTSLALRKEVEDTRTYIGKLPSERAVREIIADLNERIRKLNRTPTTGPPSTLMPLDVELLVERWREQRAAAEQEHAG